MASEKTYLVERSTVVAASAATVFALINDFHHWTRWSPWDDVDPAMTRTYSGPDSGVGASYGWSGNRKAGSGTMVITESTPGQKVSLDLAFMKPFKSQSVTTFLIDDGDAGTTVHWRMTGANKLINKVISMDKIIGKDFEKGLARLKIAAEKG